MRFNVALTAELNNEWRSMRYNVQKKQEGRLYQQILDLAFAIEYSEVSQWFSVHWISVFYQ